MATLRYSAQRELIYNTIFNDKDHPTADMIYQKLKVDNPQLSLGTVYRNLKQLEEDNKIIKITALNVCDHFDARMDNHYHMICKHCNNIFDVDVQIENSGIISCFQNKSGHIIDSFSIYFYGICKNCKEIH